MGRRDNLFLKEDFEFTIPLDPVDATTTIAGVAKMRRACRIDSVELVSAAGFTGHASNHWTVALKCSTETIGSYTTDSDTAGQGTLAAGVPKTGALSATDSDAVRAAGDVLDVVLTKAASATAFPSSKLIVKGRTV